MIFIALGCLLLGLLVGGAGLRAAGRFAGRLWRPGIGVLALAAFVGAAIMAVHESILGTAAFGALGLCLALSMRRARRAKAVAAAPVRDLALEQAASILGVPVDASKAEVQAAYLRLIRRVHPDAGGAEGLAVQLNAARDRMLSR